MKRKRKLLASLQEFVEHAQRFRDILAGKKLVDQPPPAVYGPNVDIARSTRTTLPASPEEPDK